MHHTVCLLASPRPRGNSATIAGWFTDKAREMGAQVRVHHLNRLTYRGCQGCLACKEKTDACILDDALTPVLSDVRAARNLVVATPVYWMDATAQLKAFIDRCYAFLQPDYLSNPQPSRLGTGRNLVFILTQGGGTGEHTHVYPLYREIFQWMGYTRQTLIRSASTRHLGAVDSRPDIRREAEQAAVKLFGGP